MNRKTSLKTSSAFSTTLTFSLVALTSAAACSAASTKDQTSSTTTSTSTGAGAGTTGAGGASTTSTGGTTAGPGGGTTTSTTSGSGGGSGPATSCSMGTLFAGDPLYMGDDVTPPSGTGILADPPLGWSSLVFDGSRIYTPYYQQIWTTDLSAPAPVETQIAGAEMDSHPFQSGPCAMARIGTTRGIAVLPDHSLIVTDWWSSAILHVTDPAGPTCAVEFWAGSSTPTDNAEQDYLSGDVDGPGAQAKIMEPSWIVTDDAGNAYFYDGGNAKIKKVATDAQHTVSTLATLPNDDFTLIKGLTLIGTNLYAIGVGNLSESIYAIDTTNGKLTTLKHGKGDLFAPLDSGEIAVLGAVTTDGQGLIVAGSGYIWYVTVAGNVTLLAGAGLVVDFPPDGYDPKASQPAMSLLLEHSEGDSATAGSSTFLTYHDGALYSRGHADGSAVFIEKISCP